MNRYKRYERYKDSGVEWIGEIPEEWEVKPIKYLVKTIQTGTTPTTRNHDYFDGEIQWFTPGDFLGHRELYESSRKISKMAIEDNEGRLFPKETVMIVGIGATVGKVAKLGIEGSFNQQITGIVTNEQNLNSDYLYYWLYINQQTIKKISNYTTLPIINNEFIKNFECLLPSIIEQKEIINFLSQKTAEIDDLIADKEKLIELLQEKRQAIITEAVTKGLNPNVRMKDSGIEWIGKIPEEWGVSSLRWYISIKSGDYISQENIDEEGPIPVIGGNGLMAYTNKANCNFKTIAIGRVGALCGNVHFIDYPSWITDNALYITNLRSKLCIKYLFYVLKALNLNQYANKTAQPLISSSLVKSQVIPIPPIIEQTDIVNYLDIKTAEIDDIISEIKLQIQKLKEYRQSLIYEAVTGKIYVRDYAID